MTNTKLESSVANQPTRLSALERDRQRIQTLLNARAIEIWTADASGQLLQNLTPASDPQADTQKTAWHWDRVHPDDVASLTKAFERARLARLAFESTFRSRGPDSAWQRIHLRGFPILDDRGQVQEWVGLVRDMTKLDHVELQNRELNGRLQLALQTAVAELSERKRVEDELLSQNLVLKRIVAGAPMEEILSDIVLSVERRLSHTIGSVLLLDEQRRLSFVAGPNLPVDYANLLVNIPIGPDVGSCGTAAFTGRPMIVGDIAQHPYWEGYRHWVLPHGLQACWSVPIVARMQANQGERTSMGDAPVVLGTFALYCEERTEPSAADLEIVSKAAYAAAIAIERELSHRALRDSEARLARQSAELRHASRISSLGLMAAAISHEINQPLNAISNYTSTCNFLLQQQPLGEQPAEVMECFAKMKQAALQAGEIVRRLRSFVCKEQLRREKHDFHTVISDALALTMPELRARQVQVQMQLSPSNAFVDGDAVQLQQVIVNLLTNAAEAMSSQPADHRIIKLDSTVGEKNVKCRVVDTGPGFSQDVVKRLFEPFLTTKSHGSGIGLSICRSILEDHGGSISIGNGPRGGAEIIIQLPLTDS